MQFSSATNVQFTAAANMVYFKKAEFWHRTPKDRLGAASESGKVASRRSLSPLPTAPPNRSLSSHPWLRYGLKQRKGGLPTRQRFDERSPCQESVIGLRWNR